MEQGLARTRGVRARQISAAEFAVAGKRMIVELITMIHAMGYGSSHIGADLERMLVSFHLTIATSTGKSVRIADIAKLSGVPVTNVGRHLDWLVAAGRAKQDGHRYITDFEQIGRLVTLEHLDRSIEIVQACLDEWRRLRPLLLDQLQANSAARTKGNP